MRIVDHDDVHVLLEVRDRKPSMSIVKSSGNYLSKIMCIFLLSLCLLPLSAQTLQIVSVLYTSFGIRGQSNSLQTESDFRC